MVTVINYKCRKNDKQEEFFVLVLEGNPEFIRSSNTNKLYMTARRASILSTFDEDGCRRLIGVSFPGSIMKVKCEEYDYTIPETGEAIKLDFRYEYSEEAANIEEAVFETASN